jgi:hypothetical protein
MGQTTSMSGDELSVAEVLTERGAPLPRRELMRRHRHHFVNTIHPIIEGTSSGTSSGPIDADKISFHTR